MSDIINGIGNLISSIFQVIEGAISAVVNTIITSFQTIFSVIVGAFKSVFNLAEGVVGLVIGMFTFLLGGRPNQPSTLTDMLDRQFLDPPGHWRCLFRLYRIPEAPGKSEPSANQEHRRHGLEESSVSAGEYLQETLSLAELERGSNWVLTLSLRRQWDWTKQLMLERS